MCRSFCFFHNLIISGSTFRAVQHCRIAFECSTGRGFDTDLLCVIQQPHISGQLFVFYRKCPVQHMTHHFINQLRCTADRQSVCFCLSGQSKILYTDTAAFIRCQRGCHARRLYRLDKKAMHRISPDLLQPKRNAARCSAHSAREVHKQRMCRIHGNLLLLHLLFEPFPGHRIPKKQIIRVLIIHKIAFRIRIRKLPPLDHGSSVVVCIFLNGNSSGAQQLLLPLLCICRHVHNGLIAKCGTHNADAHSKIPRGSDLYLIFSKKIAVFQKLLIGISFF